MNEINSQILREDYITIWSKYLLTDNYTSIHENLEKLCELNVSEALFRWYDFNPAGSNKTIDNNVVTNKYNNVYEYLALANKQIDASSYDIERLVYSLNNAYYNRNVNCFSEYLKWDSKIKELEKELRMLDFINYLNKAKKLAGVNCSNNPSNLINYLNYAECLHFYSEVTPFKNEGYIYFDAFTKYNNFVIKKILKMYKKARKEGVDFDSEYKFALAKALILKGKKRHTALANELLKDLAKRPLSSLVTNYQTGHINNIKPIDYQK